MQNLRTENPLVLLLELGHIYLWIERWNSNLWWWTPNTCFHFLFVYSQAFIEEPWWIEIELLLVLFINFFPAMSCYIRKEKNVLDGCNDWKRWEDPTSVCGFELASCIFLHSCEKNQMNALTHFPFPPPLSRFSQAALFKKQKNSTLTQCVTSKVFI